MTYPYASSSTPVRSMRGNRRTDTRPELRLRSGLHRRGLRFRKDYPIRPDSGRPVRPDVVFPRARIAVFVDGCFWHSCPEHGHAPMANSAYWGPKLQRNVARDKETNRRLEKAGWRVVRVWEHEDTTDAADRVEALIRGEPSPQATPGPHSLQE